MRQVRRSMAVVLLVGLLVAACGNRNGFASPRGA